MVPRWSEETGRFRKRRFAAEIGGIIVGNGGVRIHPLGMLATEVTAIELVVAVHPAAQKHQFPFRKQEGVIVFGILRMRALRQQGDQGAGGRAQASGRQIAAIIVALIAFEERGKLGNNRSGQFLAGEFFVRRVVKQGDFTGEP